ncbi:fungal specific transcription factor domain-containing protein [Aspergillus luchuensis]|uniref:Fungal specific transcription factor domain-containing protein n=1 Tax=Aspergillus kawachii TaxID=1069201 RepID=A0A146EY30_ASPKA|nr:fungal specific transcription factor domain-containing protein [Aspergillus luchuensis]
MGGNPSNPTHHQVIPTMASDFLAEEGRPEVRPSKPSGTQKRPRAGPHLAFCRIQRQHGPTPIKRRGADEAD